MPDTYFVDSNLFIVLETKVQGYERFFSRISVEQEKFTVTGNFTSNLQYLWVLKENERQKKN